MAGSTGSGTAPPQPAGIDHASTATVGAHTDRRNRTTLLSLQPVECKETFVEVSARVSSKGQVTVPRAVREALSLHEGDRVVFRVEGQRAVLARTPDLLTLAESISVPAEKRGTPWAEVLRQTGRSRAATGR